ncbi:outer membrane beta-barrel protein [Algoriphagus lacus]|nr:outer membrane beta-barrel protein [Algoriphagus lacus]
MKNKGIVIALMLLAFGAHAQISPTSIPEKKYAVVAKTKLGISQLELGNKKLINGSLTQLEVLLSRSLSKKFLVEAGIGFSQFNGNDVNQGEYVNYKNNNLRFPINVVYSRDLSKPVSLVFGLGAYGIYYARTDMTGYYTGSGSGVNAGTNALLGAHFRVSEKAGFRIMTEVQRDLSWISKPNEVQFRERMNALISLNFLVKL